MLLELLTAIALTASAAIAIVVVTLAVAATPDRRVRLAAALATWFVVIVGLGAGRVLSYDGAFGASGLGLAVILPIVAMSTLALGTGGGRQALAQASVPALISLNAIRVAGAAFLLLHAAGRLPAPFAPIAGWGDIAVGAAAPLVAWMFLRDSPWSRQLALTWNSFGLLDLVVAIGLGVTSAPGPLRVFVGDPSSAVMIGLPWLLYPGFLVPLLAVNHALLFARLARTSRPRRRAVAA